MTEPTTAAPWGMWIDADTDEEVRPATRDEWATEMADPGGVTTRDGARFYRVQGGPEMLPCGHTRQEHADQWRPLLEEAAQLVVDDLAWQTSGRYEAGTLLSDTASADLATLCVTAVLAIGLLRGQPLDLADVMRCVDAEGSPRAAMMLNVAQSWAVHHFASWDSVTSWGRLLGPKDWGMIIAVGSYAASAREMTPEQIKAFALSLLDGHDNG